MSVASLRSAKTLHDVARLLGFTPSALAYVLYKKPPEKKYKKFEIPKRHGGIRQITAPTDELKLLQRNLAYLLQNCQDEIAAENKYPDNIAHGFRRGRSIITNAKKHRRRRYVFTIDLENFFGVINFGRVRGFFIENRHFQLNEKVATVLAQIACYENCLPQGSPCSPVISNLIGNILDVRLTSLAKKVGGDYSRYADDLTFSTNQRQFPSDVATRSISEPHSWSPGYQLVKLIHKSGFKINNAKTRMQYRDSRQSVTGLIVNSKLNVRREYRHTLRAMVNRLVKTGAFQVIRKDQSGQPTEAVPGTISQLRGMLGFVDQVDRYNRDIEKKTGTKAKSESRLSSKESMYRRFLYFTELHAAPQPVLICEGPTDNLYLLHAIRSLYDEYPSLVSKQADGTKKLSVRLLKYAGTGTGRILGIESGGVGNLCNLIRDYRSAQVGFTAPSEVNPMIMVIDNDNAASKILSVISEIQKRKSKPPIVEEFIHVFGNLYVVPTPYNSQTGESVIEDCFSGEAKMIAVDGKVFSAEKNFNPDIHIGKKVFAHKVVVKYADSINFKGFRPLLDRIVAVIEAHKNRVQP